MTINEVIAELEQVQEQWGEDLTVLVWKAKGTFEEVDSVEVLEWFPANKARKMIVRFH